MNIDRVLDNKIRWILNLAIIFLQMVALLVTAGSGKAADVGSEKIFARGDGFVLTQKNVAAFQDYFNSTNTRLPQAEIVRTALKYELLSWEYQKKCKKTDGSENAPVEGVRIAENKMREGMSYIQEVLQAYVVPDAVIESYYRSHPEKYSVGKTPEGKSNLIPIDDDIKKDISFIIVEAGKERIIDQFVDGLIAKYHVVMQDKL